ncbi:serine/threonine-protein kinase VIK-like isoform X1 [Typha latifolia]|uniref:serine/threonine-protein kinase VIK-like isoform X1 n=1 Tax=Typha latifolia TaxID=4733 RepID=UPI003C2CF996
MTGGSGAEETSGGSSSSSEKEKKKEKARVSRTSLILWHTHQNDAAAVRKLLEEDHDLVNARDYDSRTPLHVASLHGWIDVAKCLLEFGADVNSQDRWKNTPLADAEGAKKYTMIELLKSYGGLSFGQNGSHFEPKPVPPPLPNKCDWEIDPSELDFSSSSIIGKGSFGEILRAYWRGTPVAVKRILPSLSDDRLVTQDFRHEVNLLVKLRHPNIVQFLGAVTERKPLMLITEFLRGGDLHQYLKEKGALNPSTAISFALDIARGMAYLHNEPNVVIHRDLKPRNVLLVNSNADHLKVGDFGLSKLIKVQNSHDVYKMTGETGSYRYMAPEVFKHRKYDKKVDVFSFAMILYEMLEGDPPLSNYEPYEAAKCVADGHRPTFRSKGYLPELKELTELCWAPDMNQRPSFIDILKKLEKVKDNLSPDNHWHIFPQ